MTHSKLPWSIKIQFNAYRIVDANGNIIGKFKDYRDADFVLSMSQEIEKLQMEVNELTDQAAKDVARITDLQRYV